MQFGFRLSKKRVLVAMLLLAVITSLLGDWVSDRLRMPAACALAPVSDYVKASASAFKSAIVNREEPVISTGQAARLRKEIDQWKSTAQTYAARATYWWKKHRSIQKIRNTYGALQKRCELIPARVILGEALPYAHSQTVAKGTIHGLEKGMRVIDVLTDRSKALPADDRMRAITDYSRVAGKPISGSVLIGWVEAAGSFTARVRLVTDKRFKIEAQLWRKIDPAYPRRALIETPEGPTEKILTRANNKAIVVTLTGDGERGLITQAIDKNHRIRVGDWLWTAGRSAKLPVRLRIGKVISVEPSAKNPNFVIAKVASAAELGALRDIFIVRSLVSPRGGG